MIRGGEPTGSKATHTQHDGAASDSERGAALSCASSGAALSCASSGAALSCASSGAALSCASSGAALSCASPQRCEVWGVLNVTPDSFSDGGQFLAIAAALRHARAMLSAGADVIDVGGESTRPRGATYGGGFVAVTLDEELRRVLPVVERLVADGARVSIDTTKAEVARRALVLGAQIVNDVSCGRDAALLRVTADAGAELVLMHSRGMGEVTAATAAYDDVVAEVCAELLAAVERAVAAGVAGAKIWIDPGLGFAKTPAQSLVLLARAQELVATGQRVLIGASRKAFLAEAAPDHDGALPPATERLAATLIAGVHAARCGAHALRVHDVREMRQALLLADALRSGAGAGARGGTPIVAQARAEGLR